MARQIREEEAGIRRKEELGREIPGAEEKSRRIQEELSGLRERLAAAASRRKELETQAQGLRGRLPFGSFKEAEQKAEQLEQQKHRFANLEELLALQDDLKERLDEIDHSDEQLALLQEQLSAREESLRALADRLSAVRHEASGRFTEKLMERARPLGMPHLRFEVEWLPKEAFDADGTESVRYLFSANKNRPLESVADIASGGEISRLMLTIKSLAADATALPTIIFDEIDTGVSGEIADKMGEIMAGMARYMQVIAITHLPQVASRGKTHYRIYKDEDGETTQTRIELLDDNRRVQEVARMLSGSELTDAAMKNARELLNRE